MILSQPRLIYTVHLPQSRHITIEVQSYYEVPLLCHVIGVVMIFQYYQHMFLPILFCHQCIPSNILAAIYPSPYYLIIVITLF
ncbi:hypothetical protein BDB01DRAFT_768720 [Pilobolus umbonatus]|nr:hypothetical protein BDB01DRAFT_768720 [Pilobolus umbonatus]